MSPITRTSSSQHYRRVIQTVAVLIVVTVGLFVGLAFSESFALRAAKLLVEKVTGRGQIKIEFADFSGTVAGGLKIGFLRVKKLNPPFSLVASATELSINFEKIFTSGVVAFSGKSESVDLIGLAPSSIASFSIPDFPGIACFAGLPVNLLIDSFALKLLKFTPCADFPFCFKMSDISVKASEKISEHNLALSINAEWRNKQIGKGSLDGILKQKQNHFEGKLSMCCVGQRLHSELCVAQKRGKTEISGYISSASVDISPLSHWLAPMWQEKFPFGFDGKIDCTGSWFFKPEVGFLSNISGNFRNFRMVALGLFIELFNLNGSWKFFDGNLEFDDSGSTFVGFPASLRGSVHSVLSRARKWDIHFDCSSVDLAKLAENLPWGVKYGFALPDISGIATLAIYLGGQKPDVNATIFAKPFKTGQGRKQHTVSTQISYNGPVGGIGKFSIESVASFSGELPTFFSRFKGARGGDSMLLLSIDVPDLYKYTLNGPVTGVLAFDGSLFNNHECLFKTTGTWHEWLGRIYLSRKGDEAADTQNSFADSISLLDLILLK
ncbi:MAG: hypothetical protein PHV05_00490 [Candidatus Riflebacteria bacterium]|nr:hypothetical protein [Candidatus Riflebacteria bacterium]